ncbi:MAG: hypothetical protein IT439_02905 [Phycisphaerales bacterium]|nr:hypothetical protein [Phycisphaerales bacterium]
MGGVRSGKAVFAFYQAPMRSSAAKRIQETYRRLSPRGEDVVAALYDRLFERSPSLRELFPADMRNLRGHFWGALAIIARNADHLDELREPLAGLGRAHERFGVESEHFELVREVLLETLEAFLADDWTRKVREAWDEVIRKVNAMMLGAREPGAARAASAIPRPEA